MSSIMKNLVYWMVAALVVFLFWSVSSRIQVSERLVSYSEFVERVESGNVGRVSVIETGAGMAIVGDFKNGESFRTFAPPQAENLVALMISKGVEVSARDANSSSWLGHLISWTPIIIMTAFLIFFMRTMQGSTPAGSLTERLRERQERRLELKARFFRKLSDATHDLSKDEILLAANEGDTTAIDESETEKALYEMLRDGTVVVTDAKKYRLRTTA